MRNLSWVRKYEIFLTDVQKYELFLTDVQKYENISLKDVFFLPLLLWQVLRFKMFRRVLII